MYKARFEIALTGQTRQTKIIFHFVCAPVSESVRNKLWFGCHDRRIFLSKNHQNIYAYCFMNFCCDATANSEHDCKSSGLLTVIKAFFCRSYLWRSSNCFTIICFECKVVPSNSSLSWLLFLFIYMLAEQELSFENTYVRTHKRLPRVLQCFFIYLFFYYFISFLFSSLAFLWRT